MFAIKNLSGMEDTGYNSFTSLHGESSNCLSQLRPILIKSTTTRDSNTAWYSSALHEASLDSQFRVD